MEVLRLSTSDLPATDRDEIVREYYGRIAQRMELEPTGDGPAHLDVSAVMLPGLMLGGGRASAMVSTRTAAMRSDGASDILLTFVRQGSVVLDGGEETVVAPGDVSLTGLDRPISLVLSQPSNAFLTLQMPRSALAALAADLDAPITRALSIDRPGMRLLEAYATSIATTPLPTAHAQELAARHLLELAALAIGPTREARRQAAAGGVRAARLVAAKAIVRENLDSPRLSAPAVAARLGVSARYLHMLFDGEPLSFAEFVTEQRLARALAVLTDPDRSHRRILDIALDAGFGDVRTFNRAFRRRFGETPSDRRARARAEGREAPPLP